MGSRGGARLSATKHAQASGFTSHGAPPELKVRLARHALRVMPFTLSVVLGTLPLSLPVIASP